LDSSGSLTKLFLTIVNELLGLVVTSIGPRLESVDVIPQK
jgi:hypothetical protein